VTSNSSDVKRREIEVYDEEKSDRPERSDLWDDDHMEALRSFGHAEDFYDEISNQTESGVLLDLGCGTGGDIERAFGDNTDATLIGTEISAERLRTAADRIQYAEFARADAENLPFDDNTFDVVLCHAVLHHLPNWDSQGLHEITRVLSTSGSLIFAEPGKYNPPAALRRLFLPSKDHTPDENPFDPDTFEQRLNTYFNDVSVEGHYVISNVVPVLHDQLPVKIPRDVSKDMYAMEKSLMGKKLRKFSWILTGVATNPER
jgi:ubiquinone/menaquinone biosynthesis C-methylase UbiE